MNRFAAKDEWHKDFLSLDTSGENSEVSATKLSRLKKDPHQRLLKVLDGNQQAKLRDLVGEPFQDDLPAPKRFPLAAVPLSLSIPGVRFAENNLLQEELKLSENQQKQLSDGPVLGMFPYRLNEP